MPRFLLSCQGRGRALSVNVRQVFGSRTGTTKETHRRRCNIIEDLYFLGKRRARIPWSNLQVARNYVWQRQKKADNEWKRTFNYDQAHRIVIFYHWEDPRGGANLGVESGFLIHSSVPWMKTRKARIIFYSYNIFTMLRMLLKIECLEIKP